MTSLFLLDVERLKDKWAWFLVLGLLSIALGALALFLMPFATIATVIVFGWLMMFAGIVEVIYAFQARRWRGFFLHLGGGLLAILLGVLVLTRPIAGAAVWTLFFAAFFTIIGLFRIIAASWMKFPNWGWAVFDGAVTLLLGVMLWAGWPSSSLWFLGLSVGVALLFRGWSQVSFAIALRRAKPSADMQRAA